MEIYFKFKSAKTYDSLSVEEPFTSVASFKQKIYQLKYKGKHNSGLCFGNDFDMMVMDARTNQHYDDEKLLIPSHSRVLIQRIPGTRRNRQVDTSPIVIPGSHIPKSSVTTTASTSSCNSVSQPNEVETSESLCWARSFPDELLCPLCKQPMKCATFTSKCCCRSFCGECIRNHLMRCKFNCVCGATDMLTDYLIPDITVRGVIRSMLESGFTVPAQRSQTSATEAEHQKAVSEKKRKRQHSEDVGTEKKCVMRTGFFPCNSFGMHFNGSMQQASSSC